MEARREQTLPNVPFPGNAPPCKPLMEARDIIHVYGGGAGARRALKGVSLALKGGELTLLMGPSGSGKTTLLSILGCMLTPTRGSVRMVGRSTEGAGPEELAKLRREHVGFIFQRSEERRVGKECRAR